MKEFTKEEYNEMIIEVVDRSIELNTINIILSLFIFLELVLIILGVIRFNAFVYVPWILAAVKFWLNDGEMKTNEFVIKYIEDLRDKHNKS